MRIAFEAEAQETGSAVLLMTATVPAENPEIDAGYQVDLIAR